MRIAYAQIVIARGESFNEEPTDLKIETRQQVQEMRLLRAESARTVSRGNLRTRVTFRVTHRHQNETEAIHFALTHPGRLRSLIEKPLYVTTERHGRRASFTICSATPRVIRCEADGPLTTTSYEFVAGEGAPLTV